MKIQTQRVGDLVLLEITACTTTGECVHLIQPIEPATALKLADALAAVVNSPTDSLDEALDRILAT